MVVMFDQIIIIFFLMCHSEFLVKYLNIKYHVILFLYIRIYLPIYFLF